MHILIYEINNKKQKIKETINYGDKKIKFYKYLQQQFIGP